MNATSTQPVDRLSGGALLGVARAVLLLAGGVGLAGATYFTFFASVEEGGVATGFDWFVAVWKLLVSLGMIVVAVHPTLPRGRRVDLAIGLVLADLVFGAIKIIGYDETESLAFTGVSLCILGLLFFLRRGTQR